MNIEAVPSTPSDVLLALRAAFDGVDQNSDGVLQADELGLAVREYYKRAEGMARPLKTVTADVKSLMAEHDTDGSGTLDFSEFVRMMLGSGRFQFAQIDEGTKQQVLAALPAAGAAAADIVSPRERLAPRKVMPRISSQNRYRPQGAREYGETASRPEHRRKKTATKRASEEGSCQIVCKFCGHVTHAMAKRGELKALAVKRHHFSDGCDCEQEYRNASPSQKAEMDKQAVIQKNARAWKLLQDVHDGRAAGKSAAEVRRSMPRMLVANDNMGKHQQAQECSLM